LRCLYAARQQNVNRRSRSRRNKPDTPRRHEYASRKRPRRLVCNPRNFQMLRLPVVPKFWPSLSGRLRKTATHQNRTTAAMYSSFPIVSDWIHSNASSRPRLPSPVLGRQIPPSARVQPKSTPRSGLVTKDRQIKSAQTIQITQPVDFDNPVAPDRKAHDGKQMSIPHSHRTHQCGTKNRASPLSCSKRRSTNSPVSGSIMAICW
jgi:hypothetical protein